jgi:hypothetical protein
MRLPETKNAYPGKFQIFELSGTSKGFNAKQKGGPDHLRKKKNTESNSIVHKQHNGLKVVFITRGV